MDLGSLRGVAGVWGVRTRGRGRKPKRAALQKTLTELRELAAQLAFDSWAPGSHKVIGTARRSLNEFLELHEVERPEPFMHPQFQGDMVAALHNETTLCLFAAWLYDNGLQANSVCTYVSMVKSSLAEEVGFVLAPKDMAVRLPRLLKGMRKLRKAVRKKRLGWRAEYQRRLRVVLGEVGEGELEAATQDALLNGARQGLLRGADFLPGRASEFRSERHACIGDVEEVSAPEPHLRWWVQPAKKSEQGSKSECLLLPKGDGVSDAYTSILRMIRARKAAKATSGGVLQDHEPLFLAPSTMGVATKHHLNSLFKQAAKVLGMDPALFSSHSGRIGGTTDLFATDCPGVLLQMQGRWCAPMTCMAREHASARTQ